MQSIGFDDPAWRTTFPHRVTPIPDEWFPGMILRCDEANHWGSGTTLAYLLYIPGRTSEVTLLYWTIPASVNLDFLAQVLAVPKDSIASTTYQPELTRLFETPYIHPSRLSATVRLHVCPVCVKQQRLLRRTLILSHIKCCPQHHVLLTERCPCGLPQQLFTRNTQPFTCPKCGLDWAEFPCIQAAPERIVFEQQRLSYYEFFLSNGTSTLVRRTLHFIHENMKNKKRNGVQLFDRANKFFANIYEESVSLSNLVHVLISLDLSLSDLVAYLGDEAHDESILR